MRRSLQVSLTIIFAVLLSANFSYSQVDFEAGKISMETTDAGRVRVYAPVYDSLQQINRLSILVGADEYHVYSYNEDADYVDTAQVISDPQFSDYEIYSSNNNSYSDLPPAILCKVNIYGWNNEPFSIVRFNILNQDSVFKDFNALIGCEFIPKVDNEWGYESIKYLPDNEIISVFKTPASTYTGFKILSGQLYSAKFIDWFDGYDAGTSGDSLFYAIMSSGSKQGDTYEAGADGGVGIFSLGASELKYNSSTDFYVAVAVGANESEMVANMDLAVAKYNEVFTASKAIVMALSNAGRVRIFSADQDTVRQLDRLSILVGADSEHVFSYNEDADVADSLVEVANPQYSDFELYSANNNSYSELPPDVLNKVNVYWWKDEGYSIVKFTVMNRDTVLRDFNALIGCEFIPQVDNEYGYESIQLLSDDIISVYKTPSSTYTGLKILSGQLYSAKFIDWFEDYDAGPEGNSLLYDAMASANKQSDIYVAGADGGIGIFSQGPVELKYQSSVVYYVAASVGGSEAEMVSNMNKAVAKYTSVFTAVEKENNNLPAKFDLKQNYPNPFNPSTKISFSLPERQNVILRVYNSLGQLVSTLVNSEYDAGNYIVDFNVGSLSSGIYFYSIQAGSYYAAKKMLMIK